MNDHTRRAARASVADVAASPAEISRRGWRHVLVRALRAVLAQETALAAAGVAFFIVWALLPALAVAVIVVAKVLGKGPVLALLSWLRVDVPDSANALVVAQLDAVARNSGVESTLALVVAAALATWSAMRGARGLMTALNAVYGQRESRTVWPRARLALGFALLGGLFLVYALAMIVGPATTASPTPVGAALLTPSRWPALIVAMLPLLSIAYRYGPSRRLAKWRWVTWGATASATIWVLGSFAFSYFAEHFVRANPLLGSLGSIVIFLFWTYLTVLVVLLGAHINAELEQHTVKDTSADAA